MIVIMFMNDDEEWKQLKKLGLNFLLKYTPRGKNNDRFRWLIDVINNNDDGKSSFDSIRGYWYLFLVSEK